MVVRLARDARLRNGPHTCGAETSAVIAGVYRIREGATARSSPCDRGTSSGGPPSKRLHATLGPRSRRYSQQSRLRLAFEQGRQPSRTRRNTCASPDQRPCSGGEALPLVRFPREQCGSAPRKSADEPPDQQHFQHGDRRRECHQAISQNHQRPPVRPPKSEKGFMQRRGSLRYATTGCQRNDVSMTPHWAATCPGPFRLPYPPFPVDQPAPPRRYGGHRPRWEVTGAMLCRRVRSSRPRSLRSLTKAQLIEEVERLRGRLARAEGRWRGVWLVAGPRRHVTGPRIRDIARDDPIT